MAYDASTQQNKRRDNRISSGTYEVRTISTPSEYINVAEAMPNFVCTIYTERFDASKIEQDGEPATTTLVVEAAKSAHAYPRHLPGAEKFYPEVYTGVVATSILDKYSAERQAWMERGRLNGAKLSRKHQLELVRGKLDASDLVHLPVDIAHNDDKVAGITISASMTKDAAFIKFRLNKTDVGTLARDSIKKGELSCLSLTTYEEWDPDHTVSAAAVALCGAPGREGCAITHVDHLPFNASAEDLKVLPDLTPELNRLKQLRDRCRIIAKKQPEMNTAPVKPSGGDGGNSVATPPKDAPLPTPPPLSAPLVAPPPPLPALQSENKAHDQPSAEVPPKKEPSSSSLSSSSAKGGSDESRVGNSIIIYANGAGGGSDNRPSTATQQSASPAAPAAAAAAAAGNATGFAAPAAGNATGLVAPAAFNGFGGYPPWSYGNPYVPPPQPFQSPLYLHPALQMDQSSMRLLQQHQQSFDRQPPSMAAELLRNASLQQQPAAAFPGLSPTPTPTPTPAPAPAPVAQPRQEPKDHEPTVADLDAQLRTLSEIMHDPKMASGIRYYIDQYHKIKTQRDRALIATEKNAGAPEEVKHHQQKAAEIARQAGVGPTSLSSSASASAYSSSLLPLGAVDPQAVLLAAGLAGVTAPAQQQKPEVRIAAKHHPDEAKKYALAQVLLPTVLKNNPFLTPSGQVPTNENPDVLFVAPESLGEMYHVLNKMTTGAYRVVEPTADERELAMHYRRQLPC
jgi:hypothetical protein